MKDYLAVLADLLQETPIERTDKTDKTPPEGSSVSFVSICRRRFRATPWPYAAAATERCSSCRYWWQKEVVWLPTHEVFGDCRRHAFETLERDNCKHHDPQQGSGLRGRTL